MTKNSYPTIKTIYNSDKNVSISYLTKKADQSITLPQCVLLESIIQDDLCKQIYIWHPYKHPKLNISYEITDNTKLADGEYQRHHLPDYPSTFAIITHQGTNIASGNNLNYHQTHGCIRRQKNYPRGVGYEDCPGCAANNHAEIQAIKVAKTIPRGSTLTLSGMWWCCQPCSQAMKKAGISVLHISKDWTATYLDIDLEFLK